MRRDALFLLGLAAVLVTGGAFAFLGGGDQPGEAAAAASATAPEDAPGAPVTASTAREHEEREDHASGDSGTSTPSRESVTSEQAEALRPGPLLLVVHGKPPMPVADCPIHFVERAVGQQRHKQSGRATLHDMDLPFLYGATLRTGSDGKVRLPSIGEPIVVSVLHEGEFGTLGLDRRHKDEVTLNLRQDETLRLEVRDAQQHAAASVPLALYQGEAFGKARQIWSAATDAFGNATATHFQEFRGQDNQGSRFCAAVRLPLAAPVAAAFQGKPLQTEPVRLQLPATGRLELTLTDRQGTPLLCEGMLTMVVVRPEGFTLDLPLDPGFDQLRAHKPLGEEPVVFEQIGTGIELRPQVKLDQEPRGFRAANVQSPQQGGRWCARTFPCPTTSPCWRVASRTWRARPRPCSCPSTSPARRNRCAPAS
jgi:hypothetical protein